MPVSPAASLIAADNRLLGWGLTDLTLYGAPPAEVTVRPADASAESVPTTALSDEAPPAPADAQGAVPHPFSPSDGGVATTAPPVAPTAFHASPAPEPPSVPPPVGSGSATQSPVATPLQTVQAADHGGAPAATAAPSDAVHDGVAPLATMTGGAASEMVGTLAGTAAALTTPVVDSVDHLAGSVGAAAAGLVNAATSAPLGATVVDTVDRAVVAPAADVAHAVVAPVIDATHVAAESAAPVAHDLGLEGLGGTNPAAGVSTLVGMVASADAFDLTHTAAPHDAAPAPSILDSLAADEAHSPLLGDHHDVSGVGHPVDDHGVHLGL